MNILTQLTWSHFVDFRHQRWQITIARIPTPHPLWRRKMEEGGGDKRFFYRYMPPLVARQKTMQQCKNEYINTIDVVAFCGF